jgi:hypothetical protein
VTEQIELVFALQRLLFTTFTEAINKQAEAGTRRVLARSSDAFLR